MFRNSCTKLANATQDKIALFEHCSKIVLSRSLIYRYLFNSMSDHPKNRTKEFVGRKLVGYVLLSY